MKGRYGVIFDFDGVMVDTEPIYFQAMQEMARRRGKEFSLRVKKEVMGTGGLLSMRIMKERLGLRESPEELLRERGEIFARLLRESGIRPMPGLFSAIRVFNQMDFAKAIASSSRREWIIWGLEELKLKDEFPVIVSGEEVREAKPAPEIFLLASKRLGLERERCLVLEDTIIGVQSAKGAGMKVIAIPNQYNQDEDFSRADLRLNSLTEIHEALIRTLLLKR